MLRSTFPLPPLAILALAFLVVPSVPRAAAAESDPKAVELAENLLEALGGADAWESTRFIRFRFAGFRSHVWDKHTGRHRLEFTSRDGETFVVLGNVVDRTGRAWKDGEELVGDDLAEALEGAYAAWINDTYWLVMPYKLLDPGVTLTYDGEETIDGETYDKVKLTFDSVGLTPGDTYWAYINRDTGLMDRWAYVLESFEAGREPTMWLWKGWTRHGDILLAPDRVNPESGRELPLSDIAVSDRLDESLFTSPEPLVQAPAAD